MTFIPVLSLTEDGRVKFRVPQEFEVRCPIGFSSKVDTFT